MPVIGKVIAFRTFAGEIPRTPTHLLPEGNGLYALNCDLAHGELRGLRGDKTIASGIKTFFDNRPIKTVYTEDGVNFYGWPYDGHVVKSQVVDDTFYRIYYTLLLDNGPIFKVARTYRNDGVNPLSRIINSSLTFGNFQPPENSDPQPVGTAAGLGPDSWVCGVEAPNAQALTPDDLLIASLSDSARWPGIPRLALRVTYFIENPAGQIVAQLDISNNETANLPLVLNYYTGEPFVHDNVFVTNDWHLRGNKIQDLLSMLGSTQRPYKYYFFNPPPLDALPIARTVVIDNTGPTNITVTYGSAQPDPTPNPPGADPGSTGTPGVPPSPGGFDPQPSGGGGEGSNSDGSGPGDGGDSGGGGDAGGDGGDGA